METLRRLEEEQTEFKDSSIACVTPRTRKSSTPSWRSTSSVRRRRTISRRG